MEQTDECLSRNFCGEVRYCKRHFIKWENGVVVEEPGTSTATMPSVLMYGDAFGPLSDWESDPEFEADEPEEDFQPTDAEVSD